MILITLDNRILYFNPGRSLDALKLNEYFHSMDHRPGYAAGHINRFVDFSGLERIDVDASVAHSISAIRSLADASQRPSKAVLFSSQPLGLNIARMFETCFLSDPIQLRTMDNLDVALEWLEATDLRGSILGLRRYP
jgi:hypothetical protein